MDNLINKSLTALFRLACRITTKRSYLKNKLDSEARPKIIKFSKEDEVVLY